MKTEHGYMPGNGLEFDELVMKYFSFLSYQFIDTNLIDYPPRSREYS